MIKSLMKQVCLTSDLGQAYEPWRKESCARTRIIKRISKKSIEEEFQFVTRYK